MDNRKRSKIIYMWKKQGLVHNDYKNLYEQYFNNTNCQNCGKEYKSTRDRCLDHDHTTGLFRAFVCQTCNVHDSYIKYPNGYIRGKSWQENNKERYAKYRKEWYETNKENIKQRSKEWRENNKEIIKEQRKEPIECGCGSVVTKGSFNRHVKSIKHLNLLK